MVIYTHTHTHCRKSIGFTEAPWALNTISVPSVCLWQVHLRVKTPGLTYTECRAVSESTADEVTDTFLEMDCEGPWADRCC